jgi:hypothetical protein
MKSKLTTMTIILALIASINYAQNIPQKISFQGRLIDANTQKPFTAEKNFTFKIGDWIEEHKNVQVSNGLYSVILGSINPIPLTLFNDWQANMKILVDGKEMAPDIEMVSVPYAFQAETATNLGTNIYAKNENLGIGIQNPAYKMDIVHDQTLGLSVDSTNHFFRLRNSTTGNSDYLRIFSKRVEEGGGWSTAIWRMQRRVDVTDMGYIQFGPNWDGGLIFGWGEKEFLKMTNGGYFGIGTTEPQSYLHVVNSKVNNTNVVRIDFNGGNVGSRDESAALLRIVSNSNLRPLLSLNGKSIVTANGSIGIGTNTPQAKLDIHGSALLGFEHKAENFGTQLKSGFYYGHKLETGDIPDSTSYYTHLIASRHGNQANNYQLQIASSYNNNDRMFFRKIAINEPVSFNPAWYEIATRGRNSFSGNQTISGEITCTKVNTPSDIRYKKNITPIQAPLQKVTQLKGVNYEWKTEEYPEKNFSNGKQIGMIAQDVEKVIPEIVHTDNEGMKSISYDKITAVLVEAIKELKAENEQIKEILCEDRPSHKFCTN